LFDADLGQAGQATQSFDGFGGIAGNNPQDLTAEDTIAAERSTTYQRMHTREGCLVHKGVRIGDHDTLGRCATRRQGSVKIRRFEGRGVRVIVAQC